MGNINIEMLNRKRQILMDSPHIETVESNVFTTDLVAPLKSLQISFTPSQSGSGDPSPTNYRAIIGRTSATVRNGDNTQTISWADSAGNVYGGYLDLVKGTIISAYQLIANFGGNSSSQWGLEGPSSAYTRMYVYSNGGLGNRCAINTASDITKAVCTHLVPTSRSIAGGNYTTPSVFQYHSGSTNQLRLVFPRITQFSTQANVYTWLDEQRAAGTPFAVCIPLATTQSFNISPSIIYTSRGTNNILVDNMEVNGASYWTH